MSDRIGNRAGDVGAPTNEELVATGSGVAAPDWKLPDLFAIALMGITLSTGLCCAQSVDHSADESKWYYVSSTLGSDAADGLTPATAKRTPAAAYDLLRNHSADRMLLRRGDEWVNEHLYPSDRTWYKSGYSSAQPLVVGSYGTGPRPVFRNDSVAVRVQTSDGVKDVRFEDLDFQAIRTATNGPNGISWWAAGGNFTLRDCRIQNFCLNMNIDAPTPMSAGGFHFERCEVLDAFPGTSGPSQGAYVANVYDVTFDHCVLDRNGYRYPDRMATMLNHNCYFSQTATGVVIRNSIVARGSATGIQLRGQRMDAIRNLVLGNPLGITMGHSAQTSQQISRGIIFGNIVLDGADIGWGSSRLPRGFGISWGRVSAGVIQDNIVAHGWTQSGFEPAYTVGDFSYNTVVRGNVGFDWLGPILSIRSMLQDSDIIGENTFVNMPGRTTAAIELPTGLPADLGGIWGGNRYFGTGNNVFRPATGNANGLAVWEDRTDDVVELNDAGYSGANISLPFYLATVAPELATPSDAAGALEVFMERVRATPVRETDPRFTADGYIAWARARLALHPLGATPQLP